MKIQDFHGILLILKEIFGILFFTLNSIFFRKHGFFDQFFIANAKCQQLIRQ